MKIDRQKDKISITFEDGARLSYGGIVALLLYQIWLKLEEIRCGLIDIEEAIERR